MMERMLRHQLQQYGIVDVNVESAGLLESAAGQPMTEFSMVELNNRGIDTDGHTARFVGTVNLTDFDFILTVGEDEANQLMENPDWNPNTPIIILGGGVSNPWEKGKEAYRECANLIEENLAYFIKLLRT